MNKEYNLDKPLIYTALGDSLTVGIGALFKPGFVKRFALMAEKSLHKKVIPFIFAKNGANTGEILDYINRPFVQLMIRNASIITISAGGNDLRNAAKVYFKSGDQSVLESALKLQEENMIKLLNTIKQLKFKKNNPYIVRLVDIYNPYPNISISEKWIQSFNNQLKSFEESNIRMTNTYLAFYNKEKQLLAFDRLHPNGEGYQLIAEELNKLGYDPIRSKGCSL
jgi:lysophospholipase L1-like esterase